MKILSALVLIGSLLGGCSAPAAKVVEKSPVLVSTTTRVKPPLTATRVDDQNAVERLRGNAGITLQWLGWDQRGMLEVEQRGAVVHLTGGQRAADGTPGTLTLDGDVVSIDADSFVVRGRIIITDTPDPGRSCVRDGDMTFLITGTRTYWRLQEMEVCDGLTDYVDIYF